jgi:hypothetical protein
VPCCIKGFFSASNCPGCNICARSTQKTPVLNSNSFVPCVFATAGTFSLFGSTERFFFTLPHRLSGTHSLLCNGYRCVKLTSWWWSYSSILIKHGGNFTFLASKSEFESLWGQEFSLLQIVQACSEVHPTSSPMGTGSSFPGGKAAGAWIWSLTSN